MTSDTFPHLSNSEIAAIIQLANDMADAARGVILPYFRGNELATENKVASGFDPVTIADRAAEQAMRRLIETHRPNDSIWGEEFGHKSGTSGFRWVLDPIDGTRGFMSGTPTWGVLIALEYNDLGPVFGIIDQPYIGERFIGGFGVAHLDGPLGKSKLATRSTQTLRDAVLFTTFPEIGTPTEKQAFQAVSEHCKLVRYGMDCYAYALVAAGQIDLVIEAGLNAYDVQAPIAVIKSAGGVVTNWSGGPAHNGGQIVAAANEEIWKQAIALLSPYAEVTHEK